MLRPSISGINSSRLSILHNSSNKAAGVHTLRGVPAKPTRPLPCCRAGAKGSSSGSSSQPKKSSEAGGKASSSNSQHMKSSRAGGKGSSSSSSSGSQPKKSSEAGGKGSSSSSGSQPMKSMLRSRAGVTGSSSGSQPSDSNPLPSAQHERDVARSMVPRVVSAASSIQQLYEMDEMHSDTQRGVSGFTLPSEDPKGQEFAEIVGLTLARLDRMYIQAALLQSLYGQRVLDESFHRARDRYKVRAEVELLQPHVQVLQQMLREGGDAKLEARQPGIGDACLMVAWYHNKKFASGPPPKPPVP